MVHREPHQDTTALEAMALSMRKDCGTLQSLCSPKAQPWTSDPSTLSAKHYQDGYFQKDTMFDKINYICLISNAFWGFFLKEVNFFEGSASSSYAKISVTSSPGNALSNILTSLFRGLFVGLDYYFPPTFTS